MGSGQTTQQRRHVNVSAWQPLTLPHLRPTAFTVMTIQSRGIIQAVGLAVHLILILISSQIEKCIYQKQTKKTFDGILGSHFTFARSIWGRTF